MIRLIEDKCAACMLCVRDCVSGVWRNIDGKPVPVEPVLCNRCSHCIAVCPHGAIEHDSLDPNQLIKLNRKNLSPEICREIITGRRSVRNYSKKPVPKSAIEDIINVARYSPTASNDQNVGYTVVTDRELMDKISKKIFGLGVRAHGWTKTAVGGFITRITGLNKNRYLKLMDYTVPQAAAGRDFILYNAPVLILVHGPSGANFISENCNIAAAGIINYAHSLGLGTCYIGMLTMYLRFFRKTRKSLKVPKGRRVYASLVLGHPAYHHSFTVSRKKPRIEWI
jgi:nitroreductase/NAD-dependent dihydropyrimidine dehydrogenase PreA subunit